jgi:hypothetical protein
MPLSETGGKKGQPAVCHLGTEKPAGRPAHARGQRHSLYFAEGVLHRESKFISHDGKFAEVYSTVPDADRRPCLNTASAWFGPPLLPGTSLALTCDENEVLYFWDTAASTAVLNPRPMDTIGKALTFDAFDLARKKAVLHAERLCWCWTGDG